MLTKPPLIINLPQLMAPLSPSVGILSSCWHQVIVVTVILSPWRHTSYYRHIPMNRISCSHVTEIDILIIDIEISVDINSECVLFLCF